MSEWCKRTEGANERSSAKQADDLVERANEQTSEWTSGRPDVLRVDFIQFLSIVDAFDGRKVGTGK